MEIKNKEKERWEIEDLVFDKNSLITLGRMIKKGFFEKIDYPVSTGKEANVYRAKAGRGYVAVKIYKIETTRFFERKKYLISDPRFNFRKIDERRLIYVFASKEYKNMEIAKKAGVGCPTPLYQENNIVAMSFLGRKGIPFPKLIDYIHHNKVSSKEGKEIFEKVLSYVFKMHKKGLVHGDLSEYNILYNPVRKKPYLIDFGQGTIRGNPNYEDLLKRDLYNITKFFSKKVGVKTGKEIFEKFSI